MEKLANTIDKLNAAIGRGAAWLALVIVVLQFALVVARYVFSLGSIWLSETVIYAHAALFLLAAAWTLQLGGHVRVGFENNLYLPGGSLACSNAELVNMVVGILKACDVELLGAEGLRESWAHLA